jgi:small-conductance mechanosensitive channel
MSLIKDLLENKLFLSIIWIIVCFILVKASNQILKKITDKKGKNISITFLNAIIKAILILATVIKIVSYSNILQSFTTTILMSSSLIVVIVGFVFQEGLSNIVHGFIITMWKPFEIGDRIQININGDNISGYVKSINLRHTVITNILDNADFIIANSQLDKANIKNLTNQKQLHRYPIYINIDYTDAMDSKKLKLAKEIISETILSHPDTIDTREDKTKPLFVKVDLLESVVQLTSFVSTTSMEKNIIVCSEIKEILLSKFKENDINFAFNHLEISGHLYDW